MLATCQPRPAAALATSGSKQVHRSWAAAAPQHLRRRRQERWAAAAAADELASSSSSSAAADPSLQPSTSYSSDGADDADESRDFVVAMAKIAWETKAEDVLVLHVAPVVYWTRYMLLATVFSRPQLNAILGKMEKEAAERFGRRLSHNPTGTAGGWELLDYGDVVLHIMTAEQRDYYALEDFYAAAEEVELPFAAGGAEAAPVDSWTKSLKP